MKKIEKVCVKTNTDKKNAILAKVRLLLAQEEHNKYVTSLDVKNKDS